MTDATDDFLPETPPIPLVFRELDLRAYDAEYEGLASTWGPTRPWRFTCRACGKVFHPLPSAFAVDLMLRHATIVGGQPTLCGGRLRGASL